MHNQVTIKDIAEIAGVSFSTVSRCLNDSDLVAEKTKQRVNKIARDLGFEFNAGARSMITSRVGTVGIILPEQFSEINVNVYHGLLMNQLRESLEKADVDLIVSYETNQYTKQNNIIRLVTRNKVDGLIILVEDLSRESLKFLKDRSLPFVCTHYPPGDNLKGQDVIYTDHEAGGRLVAEHFLEQGRTKFAVLAMDEEHLEFRQREKGFCEAVEKAGYGVTRFYCHSTFDSARRHVAEKADEFKGFDALFGSNDLMALGACRSLQDAGFSIPDDIALVGYDDSEFAQYNNPSLSSVHQPREELAHFSCDRLFNQLEKQKTGEDILKKKISIQPVLIQRESS